MSHFPEYWFGFSISCVFLVGFGSVQFSYENGLLKFGANLLSKKCAARVCGLWGCVGGVWGVDERTGHVTDVI